MAYQSRTKKRGMKRWQKILLIVIGIILVVGIGVGLFVNSYLSKINYKDNFKPNTIVEGIDKSKNKKDFAQADKDINNSLASNHTLMFDKDIMNVLLMGKDSGDGVRNSHTDSMMILSIDKKHSKLKLTSLSRATYADIPGVGHDRLGHAYEYGGTDLLIKTIEKNYFVKIDHYVSVDFEAFKEIIDIYGGINIKLTSKEAKALNSINGYNFSGAGTYKLNGSQALAYARLREIDSDRARTGRQRNIINEIIKESKSISASKAKRIMDKCLPLITTDFSKTDLLSLGLNSLSYLKWPVVNHIIPIDGTDRLINVNGLEVLFIDWNSNINNLQNFIYNS